MEQNNSKARAICILGMHRSGTSTVARTINLLGAHLGTDEKMMPPSPNNPEGYWENLDIFDLHVRLLWRLGRTWATAMPLPERWSQSDTVRPFVDELYKLVVANFSGHPLWAWKAPRACLLLPLWREVLQKTETQLSCLFVVRNPVAVASSLHRRDAIPFDRALGIWFHYNLAALKDAAGLPMVFLNYDRLIESWEPELRRCATALGLKEQLDEPRAREAINAFIKPGLRHHQSEPDRLQQLPRPVRELHQILHETSTNPSFDVRRLEATINRLSEEFHAGGPESLRLPKVSVLVPVFNGEKYLAECLDSILMQDFSDYELLISDDGSTDGTPKIIEHYAAKDPRIRSWRNPVNLKQAANLNLCLREARGQYIKFVFADDKLLATSALRQMVQALDADPSVVLVSSISHVITAHSRLIQVRDYFPVQPKWPGMEILTRCLADPVTFNPVNLIGEPTVTMFRRQPAERGFDERFRSLLDLELWFHLLEQGNFVCIAEPLSAFRRHGAQETLTNRQSGASARDAVRLKKIYFPRAMERRMISRLDLFNEIRRQQKINDESAADLAAALLQALGKGWYNCYLFRYRAWRLLQDLKFWRNRRNLAAEALPEQWHPAPTVPGRSDHPLVSVLVPVYNGEKYLAQCLDSVLAQDFTEMEILIADDGSKDGSRELIQRYADRDSRIRWWRNPVNLGLAGNFNACLRAARNDYVKYVLQDDVLVSPSAIRLMVQALDRDPAVSLVGSASYVIDGNSQRLELRNAFRQSGVMDGKAAILRCLSRNGNLIGEPSVVMFRREQAGRGYDERYKQLVDLDFWFHLLEQGRFAYLDEPLCAFRQHRDQQTAVNRESGAHVQDELMLAQYWLSRPWLREAAGGRVLFNQIYNLRKHHGERARPFIGDIMASLKVQWYALYWIEHKITRPFLNLQRWLRKRLAPHPQPPSASRS